MAEPGPTTAEAGQRPPKRAKAAAPLERGPDLIADALLKYRLKLPLEFTPGSIQANRVALRLHGSECKAYVANAQHVYEVSLGADFANPTADWWAQFAVDKGKEGVLVARNAQPGHIRQLEQLSDMAAEVQGLSSGQHGGYHVLAAVDAGGSARLLATPAAAASPDGTDDQHGAGHVLDLPARTTGECGWVGLAMRAADGQEAADSGGGLGGPPPLEVAVARRQHRDVVVFREGRVIRTIHTLQGPSAITYLPPGPYGGCADPSSGLLAVAEDHQVVLWDVRQGERGGCVQRLNVYGGGFPVNSLAWVPGVSARQQSGGGRGEGLLAATGGERSVVMLEPRKWHVAAKWPGCVKYPATHLVPSAVAPGFVYVAGLDYECAAGRWDGSCGGSAGNANSTSGGHGRAVGPAQLVGPAREAADGSGPETGGRGGLSFRGDSKWLGMATVALPSSGGAPSGGGGSHPAAPGRELVAALSLSGHLYVLAASASGGAGETRARP